MLGRIRTEHERADADREGVVRVFVPGPALHERHTAGAPDALGAAIEIAPGLGGAQVVDPQVHGCDGGKLGQAAKCGHPARLIEKRGDDAPEDDPAGRIAHQIVAIRKHQRGLARPDPKIGGEVVLTRGEEGPPTLRTPGEDGEPLALAEVDFEALIADPAIGSVARERLQIDPRARTGRAMWLLARNQPERAFKLLDGDPVEFFRDSVWPHVSAVLARRPPVELDAQQALELILTARREGDHVEARLRLGRFESKFAESAAVRDSEMLRADIGDWIARREEVERVRSEFAAHAAEGVSIDVRAVDDDLRVEIVYPLADVRFGPQVGWSRAGGEMRTGPGEVSLAQAEQRALHIATLFEPDSDVEVTAELRFPDTGEVPQLTMIRVNGVEIALAVLPDRTALAIARPVAPFRAEVFSHDLQPALTEAARAGGPTITPGAVHELRVRLRRSNRTRTQVEATLDGKPLIRQPARIPRVEARAEVVFAPLQQLAVRSVRIAGRVR